MEAIERTGTVSQDGVLKAQLKTGASGKAKVSLKAKGSTAAWPAPVAADRFFDQDGKVTVQLLNKQTPTCWTSEFTANDTKKNDGVNFKATFR